MESWIQVALVLLEAVGFLLNGLVLYLVWRQGLHRIDMWLVLFITLNDVVLLMDKLGEAVVLWAADKSLVLDPLIGPWLGVFLVLCLHLSTGFSGCLALIRFWVIVLKRPIVSRRWWMVLVLLVMWLVLWLVATKLHGGMELVSNQRFYYPSPSAGWVSMSCRVMLALWHIVSLLLIDICYPCIAMQYVSDLSHFSEDELFDPRILRSRQTWTVCKIATIVSLYNVILLPILVLFILDLVSKPMSVEQAGLAGIGMMSLTIINPIMLLTLHYGTAIELQSLRRSCLHLKKKLSTSL
ncbi:hypothetical protein DSO57_1019817 [Entomophthora muscae]|uniref:Uncharacterized protein n=1 Tax=Entomophthora muscae TaxID=34485 RepID=A0ACC2S5Z0_9FUNG|nr:hypothetical protein DSO57_1019817 [Entomophthora muscae]